MTYPVLVVDDEPWLTNLYAEALGSKGIEVTMMRSADDALAALETREFAAIISDIRMPSMDGLRFYQTVAERFPQALRHFGFYTAYDDEVARQFITNREVPLLRKPCRLGELEEFVLRLVGR